MSVAHFGAEAYRLRLLTTLESELRRSGFDRIAGVDEAGRGSLAGPVVAAAVIPDPDQIVPGVDDSKKITPARRALLAGWVKKASLAWGVAVVPASVIDRINILQATRRAMAAALARLDPAPHVAIIDAVDPGVEGMPILPIVRGDMLSYAVACASIVAKTERDGMMCQLHEVFPRYNFFANKGYAAPEHLEALTAFGPCPDHRLTFKSVLPQTEC